MAQGYLMPVLHAHLPYVRHLEHEHYLEERWLNEAITDCYIPLLQMMDKLRNENIPFKLTMSLTPTLLSMLNDSLLCRRYLKHINLLIELAEREKKRTKNNPELNALAEMYRNLFCQTKKAFEETYHKNIINGFRDHMESGNLEIVTSGATHGYFPLMESTRKSVKAQVMTACKTHEHFLGRKPKGIWLPECGYYPGDDEILKENGIKYFFTDTHGVFHASPRPKYAVFAPVYCPSGTAAFARDPESSKQVWSMSEGYPGDRDYREYYRDVGFDLDFGYVWPFIHPEGIRVNTGIKYFRITGPTSDKELYDPARASFKAALHAENFVENRIKQINYLAELMDRKPLIVSPYDAELFGHWWFEGPQFLEQVIRKAAARSQELQLITANEYLQIYPVNQITQPCMSSWGNNGYNDVWLEGTNDWIYPHLHKAAERMTELANKFPRSDGMRKRALDQAVRELLLAQSSDWAFIMKTGSMVEYAVHRTKIHLEQFNHLYRQIKENKIDEDYTAQLEQANNLFPNIDYAVYQ